MLRQLILLALPFSLLAFQTKAFAGITDNSKIVAILLFEEGNLVFVYPKGGREPIEISAAVAMLHFMYS
jgi:hypothetical protein